MSAFKQGLRIVVYPIRAAWLIVLIADFIIVSAVCLFFASFVAYGIALIFSYALLPDAWTQALWHWAVDLYDHSSLFKAATIILFAFLALPILRFWPARDPVADALREREMKQLNEDLIAFGMQKELNQIPGVMIARHVLQGSGGARRWSAVV
jgi:hypothetical protein